MNAPLPSLPRSLPPPVAAASLAATLRGARRRRIRRRAGQSAVLLTVVGAAVLGLHSMGGAPTGGVSPVALNPPGQPLASSGRTARNHGTVDIPLSLPGDSWQVEPPSAAPAPVSGPGSSAVPPVAAASAPPSVPPPVPMPVPVKEESSFVLVRTQPVEIIRTPSPAADPEPANPPATPADAAAVSHIAVSTASLPPPLIITTARTVSAQAIATADGPEIPDSASDADLFALADGRPAALCRMASGDARWFWLDRLAVR